MIRFFFEAAVVLAITFASVTPQPPLVWDRNPEEDMKEYRVYHASVIATPYDCECCEEADPVTLECVTVKVCTCYDYRGPWDPTMPTPWMLGDTVPQPDTGPVSTTWDAGDPGLNSFFVFKVCAVDQADLVDLDCPVIPPSQQVDMLIEEMEAAMARIDRKLLEIEAKMGAEDYAEDRKRRRE